MERGEGTFLSDASAWSSKLNVVIMERYGRAEDWYQRKNV